MATFNPLNESKLKKATSRPGSGGLTGYRFFDEDEDEALIRESAPGYKPKAGQDPDLESFLGMSGPGRSSAPPQQNTQPAQTTFQAGAAAAPQKPEIDPDPTEAFDSQSVAQLEDEQDAEYRAINDELDIAKAQALQQTAARAGAGGMGLTGATAALMSDVGRSQDRGRAITMAELGDRQRDEVFDLWQQKGALWAVEEDLEYDLDGDGNYGPPNQISNNKDPKSGADAAIQAAQDSMRSMAPKSGALDALEAARRAREEARLAYEDELEASFYNPRLNPRRTR